MTSKELNDELVLLARSGSAIQHALVGLSVDLINRTHSVDTADELEKIETCLHSLATECRKLRKRIDPLAS